MNKLELINTLEYNIRMAETLDTSWTADEMKRQLEWVLQLVKKLDEPKKVVVPQVVVNWYEKHKDNLSRDIFYFIYDYYNHTYEDDIAEEFAKWFHNNTGTAINTIVKMKLYGYTADKEKEKLYTVEIPNPNGEHLILCKNKSGKVFIKSFATEKWKLRANLDTKLTEKEIKKDYASVWQFAKEVEDN